MAVAQKNPQYFFRLLSNDHRSRKCERLFFPSNIGTTHLMPSIDRNAVLSD
jgi:hypothetical protein